MMANPQPSDPHGILVHVIKENLIMRKFTEQQRNIIDLIIRLSWDCGNKAWQYGSYKDFEVIGMYKSDVREQLDYLELHKVILHFQKYKLLMFNKNYDEWLIPYKPKSTPKKLSSLVHSSLKSSNEVRNILTVLEVSFNKVSDSLTELVENDLRFNPPEQANPTHSGVPKESIKYTTTTVAVMDKSPDGTSIIPVADMDADSIQQVYPDAVLGEESDADSINAVSLVEDHYASKVLGKALVQKPDDMQMIFETCSKYPADFIIKCIDTACKDHLKRNNGILSIKSFRYFLSIFEEEWIKKQLREQGKTIKPEEPVVNLGTRAVQRQQNNKLNSKPNRFHNFEQRTAKYSKSELEALLKKKGSG